MEWACRGRSEGMKQGEAVPSGLFCSRTPGAALHGYHSKEDLS